VFGNDRVGSAPNIDAQFFDAPIDAPPACPAGTPVFRPDLYDVETTGSCDSYSFAETGTVLAVCKTDDNKVVLESGSLAIGVAMKMPLQPVATDLSPTATPLGVRVAPEGDFALVRVFDSTVTIHALREVSGMWTDLGEVPILPGQNFYSPPTRGPVRHLLEWDELTSSLIELVGDGTSWTPMAPYIPEGFTSINYDFGLTPDGLRMVTIGGSTDNASPLPRYGARPDLSSLFASSARIDEPIEITSPFLTNDCDALFFIGLARLLYVKQ
jgi:hypothetical protein